MEQMHNNELSQLSDQDRLKAYQAIINGCSHLWSKGTLQVDRLKPVLDNFIKLAENDPYFIAHFTSYAVSKLDSKDLKVVSTFVNSLNDADGTPFSPLSAYKKPNLRIVSQAAVQQLDPKLVLRVIQLANIKQSLGTRWKDGTHFSRSLKTAVKKYILYRENNPKALEGIKKAGFSKTFKNLYRAIHLSPSTEAAGILGWPQKDGREIEIKKSFFDFKGLSDLEIAKKIRKEKLPPMGVLGALPDKISPVIAAAILEQASGDQAVILREMFDSQGLLKDKEVMNVFKEKIKTAKTALDRVDKITTEVDDQVQKELKKARAEKRKEIVGDIGRVFLHIDISGSMERAIEIAKERGAIIAECVQNPKENFFWGLFNDKGKILKNPKTFEKDAFAAILYGVKAGGSTDCLANYEYAREKGCDIDIYITDQEHNSYPINQRIVDCDAKGLSRPNASVIVDVGRQGDSGLLYTSLLSAGIPVSIIKPQTLTESALVAQAVKSALRGAIAVIDEIMNTPLLTLPEWWDAV